jgi:hypothetical protein
MNTNQTKTNEIQPMPSSKYPKRISVAVSDENYEMIQELKAQRKDTATFLRAVIHEALSRVAMPISNTRITV